PGPEEGWTNSRVGGPEEGADICADGFWASGNEEFHLKMLVGAPLGTASNGALYNQVINKHDYYLPQLYSNEAQGCRQRRALPPAVTRLSLASGPQAGGTKVKITGLNFKNPDVTGVLFGKVPAKSFTVTSSSIVAAVAPAAAAAGPVDITVTTSAGTSAVVSADTFTYTAG
ncbi:MAG: IPT/TIG domain-containing protein, partial [Candidatus Saccharimonadales bacterium]